MRMNDYYTYAYLRENGTPYYIGKGKGSRAFDKAGRKRNPPPKERILFLKKNLTEEEAFKHEIYMIAVLGRKDLGTGILWNFTDGGEGASGWVMPEERKREISEFHKGRPTSEETKRKIGEANKGKTSSMKGRSHREESKQKTSESLKGRKRPPEVLKKAWETRRKQK